MSELTYEVSMKAGEIPELFNGFCSVLGCRATFARQIKAWNGAEHVPLLTAQPGDVFYWEDGEIMPSLMSADLEVRLILTAKEVADLENMRNTERLAQEAEALRLQKFLSDTLGYKTPPHPRITANNRTGE